jgi:hypothetical protein
MRLLHAFLFDYTSELCFSLVLHLSKWVIRRDINFSVTRKLSSNMRSAALC